jgi:ATP synthase protein I
MTESPEQPDRQGDDHRKQPDPLEQAVRTRRARRLAQRREGERSIGQNLAMIGALGWTVVTPTLLGVFGGRWLDQRLDSGIFWTVGLMIAGLTAGCWLGWKRMHNE